MTDDTYQADVGLVGFFDILGYKEIIANNLIQQAAEIIGKSLLRLPDSVKKKLLENFRIMEGGEQVKPEIFDKTKNLIQEVKTLIVSDTIILAMLPESKKKVGLFEWFIFLGMVSYLLRHSFDAGFPLRGAIDYGDFYIEKFTFAGKPFVESYTLTNRLALSGCILTRSASDEIKKYASNLPFSLFLFPYLVPFSNGEETHHLAVDWLSPIPEWGKVPSDIRQYIVSSFCAHMKHLRREVVPKIDNTEMMLRYRMSTKNKSGTK